MPFALSRFPVPDPALPAGPSRWTTPAPSDPASAYTPPPRRPKAQGPKEPSKKAIQCYQFSIIKGGEMSQATIAGKLYGDRRKQGQVSKDIKAVRVWLESGNVLPELARNRPKEIPTDPSRIDLGARRDDGRRRDE